MLNHLSKEHTSIYEYHTDDYVCARIIDKNQDGVPEPEDDDDDFKASEVAEKLKLQLKKLELIRLFSSLMLS